MKSYVKPQLFIESYELSQHVAACQWDWINLKSDSGDCFASLDGAMIQSGNPDVCNTDVGIHMFSSDSGACNTYMDETGSVGGEDYCYTNGSGGSGSGGSFFQS